MRSRLTRLAARDVDAILRRTELDFGVRQFETYFEIIEKGVALVGAEPFRPTSKDQSHLGSGVRSFHLELVRGRRGSAAHILYYGVHSLEGLAETVVYRVLHEAMEPKRRLAAAFRDEKART